MPWPVIQRAIYGNSVLSDRVIGEPDTCEHNKEFTSHWGKACIWRLIPVSQAVVIELNCGDCEEVSTCMPLCVMMSSKYRTSWITAQIVVCQTKINYFHFVTKFISFLNHSSEQITCFLRYIVYNVYSLFVQISEHNEQDRPLTSWLMSVLNFRPSRWLIMPDVKQIGFIITDCIAWQNH